MTVRTGRGGLPLTGGTMTGDLTMGAGTQILLDAGTTGAPGVVVSGGNSGFYSVMADEIGVSIDGTMRFSWSTSTFSGANAAGPRIISEASSYTNPTFVPDRTENESGVGGTNNDVSLIAVGVEGIRVTTTEASITGGLLNGEFLDFGSVTNQHTLAAAATSTISNFIPAGAFLLSLTVRVTTAVTGATSFDIGDGATADLWGDNISINLNTTTDATDYTTTAAVGTLYITNNNLVFTAVGSNFTAGVIRASATFLKPTPATA